jgi:hypothetical protein
MRTTRATAKTPLLQNPELTGTFIARRYEKESWSLEDPAGYELFVRYGW